MVYYSNLTLYGMGFQAVCHEPLESLKVLTEGLWSHDWGVALPCEKYLKIITCFKGVAGHGCQKLRNTCFIENSVFD